MVCQSVPHSLWLEEVLGPPRPPPMHRGKFYLKGSVSLRVPLWLVLPAEEARALGEES